MSEPGWRGFLKLSGNSSATMAGCVTHALRKMAGNWKGQKTCMRSEERRVGKEC